MSGTKRWIKIIVVSLLIGVLLGGGITIARLFFPAAPEKLLNRGEKAYAQGEEALKAGDGVTAAARFEEANLQANKALDAMERERHKDSNRNAEAQASLARLEGEGLWLKSRALRDSYFAHALAQGRPFPDTTDPISGVKFRSLLYIPDPKNSPRRARISTECQLLVERQRGTGTASPDHRNDAAGPGLGLHREVGAAELAAQCQGSVGLVPAGAI